MTTLLEQLHQLPELPAHPHQGTLLEILSGPTGVSSAGYPYIADDRFRRFIEQVPHLFQDGLGVLSWLSAVLAKAEKRMDAEDPDRISLERSARVVRTMVFTAGVTAPPDLWLLRQVISAHHRVGSIDLLLRSEGLSPDEAADTLHLDRRQLEIDWALLHVRGYLERAEGNYRLTTLGQQVVRLLGSLPEVARGNLVPVVRGWLTGEHPFVDDAPLERWWSERPPAAPTGSWTASARQMGLGYRLVPLVLALRVLEVAPRATRGEPLPLTIPDPALHVLEEAGLTRAGVVTGLGQRVLHRGPGPMGIIAAYHPYTSRLEALLRREAVPAGVSRGENVAASQDANRASFEAANNALDAFCEDYNYRYEVFIEHAVGQGEATRQRFLRSGEGQIAYFGADLEDAAIDEAVKQQQQGTLPASMTFIRRADIGEPERVIEVLRARGLAGRPTVMVVGNGFHEIRNQTNDRMIAVFRAYREAGIVLLFTEETALGDHDLLHTAWNTYHAGFRYVHEMSGQGLRPIWEKEGARSGWRRCAMEAGYAVLDAYSHRSRTIYPYPLPDRDNPAISVTYFCVPGQLAEALGVRV